LFNTPLTEKEGRPLVDFQTPFLGLPKSSDPGRRLQDGKFRLPQPASVTIKTAYPGLPFLFNGHAAKEFAGVNCQCLLHYGTHLKDVCALKSIREGHGFGQVQQMIMMYVGMYVLKSRKRASGMCANPTQSRYEDGFFEYTHFIVGLFLGDQEYARRSVSNGDLCYIRFAGTLSYNA
jgi:hypothetical protein